MTTAIQLLTLLAALAACAFAAAAFVRAGKGSGTDDTEKQLKLLRENLGTELQQVRDLQSQLSRLTLESQSGSMENMQKAVSAQLGMMTQNVNALRDSLLRQLEGLRVGLNGQMEALKQENTSQLNAIRGTVDSQLQETLDRKLKQSFDTVSRQLGLVQQGLGEMQTLASGVGDLKKILGNVKTRGILGELQLGAILSELMAPEQYVTNVVTVPGSRDPVEFAVKLPGAGDRPVLLPIDSKFPADCYTALLGARDSGDPAAIQAAEKELDQRLLRFAKDISGKYIHVPETTEFAVLFLPAEGLYAEAVSRGLIERLQKECHIMLAGPTTMAALLSSLQMGFRTLAIQKRSGEVWQLLASVKTEFSRFEDALVRTQQRLSQAGDELEKLVGVRTRAINRRLQAIEALPGEDGEEKNEL